MKCKKCNLDINDMDKFCPYCGKKIENENNNNLNLKIIIGGIIIFIVMIGIFIYSFMMCFMNTDTKTISANEFQSIIEQAGYKTEDISNEYDNIFKLDTYYILKKESSPYEIGYIKINDKNSREAFYKQIFKEILKEDNNITGRTSINVNNYQEYSFSGDYYQVAVLKNDTILYGITTKEHRNELIQIVSKLGYHYEPNWSSLRYLLLEGVIIALILLISLWKIYKKISGRGWIVLIPIYNLYYIFKAVFGHGFYIIFLLIPIVNAIFIIMLLYRLGKSFGKSDGFSLCLIFMNLIFLPILAFDNSKYLKVH